MSQKLLERSDQRVEMVCSHVTYEIATGTFAPGAKLPSVRAAAERWNVDHRIILRAYKRLQTLGLVKSVPCSGYYVSTGESNDLISRHRFELESMFNRVASEISRTTNLSVLGAIRYLAQLAEIRAGAKPECIFVECTRIQASGHAAEITERLSIPCMPMTTEQIAGKASRIPDFVRVVMVTGFHYSELRKLQSSKRFNYVSVPIEVSPELTQYVAQSDATVVYESDEAQAQHMVDDIQRVTSSSDCRLRITADINAALDEVYGSGAGSRNAPSALLSPRLWGQVDDRWREHPQVRLLEFRIVETAWPTIADSIGLPLGTIPGARI